MLFFYIRHGRPTYNPDELKPIGKRQAEAVAKRLAMYGIDRVFASTSNRAIQTALPTCEICERELTTLDWCNESHAWKEMSHPRHDGTTSWAFADPAFQLKFNSPEVLALGDEWHRHRFFKDTSFGSGIRRVHSETDAFFASLGYRHDRERKIYIPQRHTEERVALFAHEGFGKMFLSSLLDIPYPYFCTHFDMSYTGMTVIEFSPCSDDFVIPRALTVSTDSHLFKDGLPTFYQNRIYF